MAFFQSGTKRFGWSLKKAFQIILILWIIHLIQVVLGTSFYQFGGLYPREIYGLKGILLSPLLHGDFMHLISNSAPLFVLTTIILFFYTSVAYRSIFLIYILTGLAVWLFGRPVFHIGASGVVYGMVAFVFWNGIFLRNIKSIALSLIVAVLYSGMFYGVLPNEEGISWESHLLGAIVGIMVSYMEKRRLKKEYIENQPVIYDTDEPAKPFFNPDVFDRKRNDPWA
jgi:membrane associated rhomboid family serine protease